MKYQSVITTVIIVLFAIGLTYYGTKEDKTETETALRSQLADAMAEMKKKDETLSYQYALVKTYRGAADSTFVIWPNIEATALAAQLEAGIAAIGAERDTIKGLTIEGELNYERRIARLKGQAELVRELVKEK